MLICNYCLETNDRPAVCQKNNGGPHGWINIESKEGKELLSRIPKERSGAVGLVTVTSGYVIKLQYFKEGGKYYSSGEYITHQEHHWDMVEEVRQMKRDGKLPGLVEGAREFAVFIEACEPWGFPRLIPYSEQLVTVTKCIVKDCGNEPSEGEFIGPLCMPCHAYITTGKGTESQAYRNGELPPIEINEVQGLALIIRGALMCTDLSTGLEMLMGNWDEMKGANRERWRQVALMMLNQVRRLYREKHEKR